MLLTKPNKQTKWATQYKLNDPIFHTHIKYIINTKASNICEYRDINAPHHTTSSFSSFPFIIITNNNNNWLYHHQSENGREIKKLLSKWGMMTARLKGSKWGFEWKREEQQASVFSVGGKVLSPFFRLFSFFSIRVSLFNGNKKKTLIAA